MKIALGVLSGALFAAMFFAVLPTLRETQAQPAPAPTTTRTLDDKPWLGIQYQTDDRGGWLLDYVHVGSPAWDAGLVRGDTIIAIEVLQHGQPLDAGEIKWGQTLPYLAAGLETSKPGTEFKLRVKRGAVSLEMEKAFAVDFPREKIEIPAVQPLMAHLQRMNKEFKQQEWVWVTVKSASYRAMTESQTQLMNYEAARLQVSKLQQDILKISEERVLIQEEIKRAIAQKDLAKAQEHLARLEARNADIEMFGNLAKLVLGLLF